MPIYLTNETHVASQVVIADPRWLWFRPRITRTIEAINCFVWHHTASEVTAKKLFQRMKLRRVNYHFVIDRDGLCFQMVALNRQGSHAKKCNSRSVGIAFISKGRAPSEPKVPRDSYPARVHGRYLTMLKPYPKQLETALLLVRELHTICKRVPRIVSLESGLLAPGDWLGHIKHSNVTIKKIDPGSYPMEYLNENLGWNGQ